MANKVICPECGRDMRLIGGKNGDFYGCTGYPDKCRKTLSRDMARAYTQIDPQELESMKTSFRPSHYQQALFDAIESIDQRPKRHIVIDAKAGSGKTTSIVQGVLRIPNRAQQKVAFVAFNNNVVDTLRDRLPPDCDISTTHSAAFKDVQRHLGFVPKIDRYKVNAIAERFLPKHLTNVAAELVDKVKNTLAPTDELTLEAVCDKYDLDITKEMSEDASEAEIAEAKARVYAAVPRILEINAAETSTVDFTDMLWLPVYNNWPIRKLDWLLADEVQDWNRGQIEWGLRAGSSGHLVAVGDPDQSIYGWRGADTSAMDNLTRSLDADVLPLSICYRCPTSHIELAQQIVPEIEAAPNAKPGVLGWMGMHELTYHPQHPVPGDLILCRVNAPLIKYAYAFLRENLPVTIRGRDIGEGLLALIKKLKADSLDELAFKAHAYYEKEYAKLMKNDKEGRANALTDRIDTLLALIEGVDNLHQLIYRIDTLFPRQKDSQSIVLSTVHRAKGDEAKRVFILRPDLIPHPRAHTEDQIRGERCVKYVSLTRAKEELWFVERS